MRRKCSSRKIQAGFDHFGDGNENNLTKGTISRIQKILNVAEARFDNNRVGAWRHCGLAAETHAVEPFHDQVSRFILGSNYGIDHLLGQMASIKLVVRSSNL